ncbi:peroxiredoxin-like family protein [Rhizobium calliandrae]|uniref:thioredoxin-dependent peroxiredoxin n=1 Tax=Rhizobium calliandrae TaxID=1312182 RepID=A0ABT7KM28_9HYPH|nr:peroxiredoxin-like family protein [Rhizobium calliandrae]MDL2409696.1 peroxiredoxin-like family protein [Rhizobium calliandrae]
MDTDIINALAQAAEYLKATGQTEKALTAGRRAPDFCFPDQDGVKTSAVSMLRRGPLLLIFYSGGWCPSCVLGLKALEEVRPSIEARGASLVAISQQTVEENARTRRTTQVSLPILCDKGGKVARQFGVRWRVPELLQTLHLKSGIDLPSLHGEDSWTLPIPARFVVDQRGVIVYSEVDPDQTHRSNPSDLLPVLDRVWRAPGA